jgi:transcription elongation factor Elf1
MLVPMQKSPDARADLDLSFLCMTPACHDRDVEVACGPASVLGGGEVICSVCGARYKLTVAKSAGTYLLLPTRVLRN